MGLLVMNTTHTIIKIQTTRTHTYTHNYSPVTDSFTNSLPHTHAPLLEVRVLFPGAKPKFDDQINHLEDEIFVAAGVDMDIKTRMSDVRVICE